MSNSANRAGLDRLDVSEAQRVCELVQVKMDSFLALLPDLPGKDYEEALKEAYMELLFHGILRINNNEDPREKINSPKMTPEVVRWFDKAALALDEEKALREKYSKALSGENITEH